MNYSKKELESLQEVLDTAVRGEILDNHRSEKILRGVEMGEFDLNKTMEELEQYYEVNEKSVVIENKLKMTFPNMKFTSTFQYNYTKAIRGELDGILPDLGPLLLGQLLQRRVAKPLYEGEDPFTGALPIKVLEFKNNCGQSFSVSITKDTKWNDFQRMINKLLSCDTKKCKECSICYEDKYKQINCNICGERHCYACYVDNFKTNYGKIICPFCRHTIEPLDSQERRLSSSDMFSTPIYIYWLLEAEAVLESKKKFMLIPKESEKKDPVLQAKLEEEARESFSVDITNNKVSHKSRKKKNKNKNKNRRK